MPEQSTSDTYSTKRAPITTVLVVDDDDNWCFVTKMLLKRAGVGQQIITASIGLEALKKLQDRVATGEKLPELVFLDLKMPVMDGFEFLESVTNSAELNLSNTRIFICTSSMHSKDQERADGYPIAGFIPKPLTQEILADLIS